MNRALAWIAFLVASLWLALPARAHELSMAEMELRETAPGQYMMTWTAGGKLSPAEELRPIWPMGCKAGDGFVRCGDGGLSGTLRMEGVGKNYSAAMVKVRRLDSSFKVYTLSAGKPSVRIHNSSDGGEDAGSYLYLGVEHILLGVDHLLFVLGLLLIVRDRWMLVKTISAFTVAHSITLAASTLGVLHVPALPLNASIALSILFLGPEIVRSWHGGSSFTLRHPWVVAFAFGLLHGFGFASGLAQLGLPEREIPLALLMFNLGVEAGQLAFVLAFLLLLRSARLLGVTNPLLLERLPGYAVGSLGAFWSIQRVAMLLKGVV